MATDNFNRANESPLASPWASWGSYAALRVLSNQCRNAAGSDSESGQLYGSSSAQSSQVDYVSGVTDGGAALHCSAGADGYISTAYNEVEVFIFRVDDGSYTELGHITGVYVASQPVRLRRSGNDLILSIAGVDTLTVTDTTYTGGSPGVFMFAGDLIFDNWTDGVAGGQDIEVGLASETDSAFSVGKLKSLAVGQASETDTAFGASTAHSVQVGLAEETDSAFSVGKFKSKTIGLASEIDTALSVTLGGDLPTSYSTSFPLTENPLSEGGMFRVGTATAFYGTPRTTPGKCFAATFVGEIAADYDDCLAHLVNHAVPVNHRVMATVFRASSYNPSDTHEIGLYLRMVIGEEFVRGYEILFAAGGSFQVVRWEGTDHDLDNFFTGISVSGPGPGTLADGDVIAAEVIGDDFEVFKNGVSVATFTDSTFSDGNPGMGFFVRPGDTTKENFCITSWSTTEAGVPMSVSVGQAEEIDTAFSVGKVKSFAAGLTSETDSALSVTAVRAYAVGLASETDSAFSVSRLKSLTVGLPLEADGAFGVLGGQETGGGRTMRRLGLGLGLG